MVRLSAVGALLCCAISAAIAQSTPDISGTWQGKLSFNGISLRIVFHIQKAGPGYRATLDSPDQGAKDIPCGDPTLTGNQLTIPIPAIKGEYQGLLDAANKKTTGTWSQGMTKIPLNLDKVDHADTVVRPQTPRPPYPYRSEEVVVANQKSGDVLAGTLTIPAGTGPFPAVVLITGSGPQDRDESLMGHRPFAVLADFLSRRGIAVLRYDDRGVAKSTGQFGTATSFDFADDAQAVADYLGKRTDIDPKRIGLMGHSEGGLIAPIVAARDPKIAFIVLMAGPGLPGDQVIFRQSNAVAEASGIKAADLSKNAEVSARIMKWVKSDASPEEVAAKTKEDFKLAWANIPAESREIFPTVEAIQNEQLKVLLTPWFRAFVRYDPRPTLAKVRVPVLVLNGSKDLQVDAQQNVPAVNKALREGGNRKVTSKILPGLNHLFQPTATGLPSEYATIETTLDPSFLKVVGDWFDTVVKRL
jgi:uncharacterized protein